jgi:hypothetical protein
VRRDQLAQLFNGAVAPGVYRLTGRIPCALLAEGADHFGWRFFYIDGSSVLDKATFLPAAAEAMDFPSYFGHNWDAFEEMVNDLSWAPGAGYLLLYDDVAHFATYAPAEWAVALDILQNAIANWRTQGLPMIVLLRRGGSALSELPRL